MTNLLEETLEELKENGKSIYDVLWVGDDDFKTTWENFAKIAKEYCYNPGFSYVYNRLKIVGNDWWLERNIHNEVRWWEFKTIPKEPLVINEIISCRYDSYNSKVWKN